MKEITDNTEFIDQEGLDKRKSEQSVDEISGIKENEDESVCAEENVNESDSADLVMQKQLNVLEEKIEQLNQLFVQKIQHSDYEEKILDQMHSELQKYKEDLYSQLVRPILLDLIEIRESIKRVGASYAAKPEDEQGIPLRTFMEYTYDIQDILDRNNITVYDSSEGDDYVPLRHKAIKKITTAVEEQHGKIASVHSSGYEYNGKTILPEKVYVYVYQKPEVTEGEKENG